MKLFLAVNFFCGLYLSNILWSFTCGQYFEDPKDTYVPMEFDAALRGSWNISDCLVSYMTCLETIRPDFICSVETKYMETACNAIKQTCHDHDGPFDSYPYRFVMFELDCRNDNWQEWT